MKGIILTTESIQKAREHFAAIHLACIADAKSGVTRVNDLPAYIKSETERHDKALSGEYDNTFTFRQYAAYVQTGICYPLLP